MKKYKLYCGKWSDTIVAKIWSIDGTVHKFYNENDDLICVWPTHNTIVEVVDFHSNMKSMLNASLTGGTINNITEFGTSGSPGTIGSSGSIKDDGKINHNISEL